MRLKTFIEKLRRPAPQPLVADWTVGWSLRDLADLPPHHPRRNER
jgi:hypothetical protein